MKAMIAVGVLVIGAALAAASLNQCPTPIAEPSHSQVPQLYSAAFLEELFPSVALQTGESAFSVSKYFCEFAMAEPDRFFRVTVKHPKEFAWWLDRLPDLSFTDYGGCDTSQECLRTSMIFDLKQFEPTESAIRAQQKQLLDRLASITIRHVD